MKMNRLYILFAGVLSAAISVLASCSNDTVTEEKKPSIHITSGINGEIEVQFNDTIAYFDYEILNPVDEDVRHLITFDLIEGQDWVKEIVLEEFVTTGTVTLKIPYNDSLESRNAVVNINYVYGDDMKMVSDIIVFTQLSAQYYNLDLDKGICVYRTLSDGSNSIHNYAISLGVDTYYEISGADIYSLDLYSTTKTEDGLPVTGTYTLVDESTMGVSDMTMAKGYTYFVSYEQSTGIWDAFAYLNEGMLDINRNGDIFTIKGEFYDESGIMHIVDYEGELDVRDGSKNSSFVGDTELNLKGLTGEAHCFGTYEWSKGNYIWSVEFVTADMKVGSPIIVLELITASDIDIEKGIPTGTYAVASTSEKLYQAGTATLGLVSDEGHLGSWYYTCGIDGSRTQSDPMAPFNGGDMRITNNQDGTVNITLNVYDDAGNLLTGTVSGVPMTYTDAR